MIILKVSVNRLRIVCVGGGKLGDGIAEDSFYKGEMEVAGRVKRMGHMDEWMAFAALDVESLKMPTDEMLFMIIASSRVERRPRFFI